MERAETLAAVRRLLELYNGITIDFVKPMSGATRIVFKASDQVSLARVMYCSLAANLPSHVWSASPGETDRDRADPGYLRYEFRVPDESGVAEPPNELEILGIYLVWDLAHRDVLDRPSANRLLTAWRGAEI